MSSIIHVFFRKWPDGDIIAIWPDSDTGDMLNSYEHVGQHSDAHFDLINELTPATSDEYAGLLKEMENIGYTVFVRTERNYSVFG